MRGRVTAFGGAVCVLLCLGAGVGVSADGPVLVVPQHIPGALDSTLAQIARAQKTKGNAGAVAAAKAQGVQIQQSKVPVVVTAAAPQDAAAVRAAVAASGGVVQAARDDTVAALVPAASLDKLAASSAVTAVHEPARGFTQTVDEGVAITGADTVQSGGINGTGVKVAVIDLGFTSLTTVFSGSPSWLASTQNFGCVNSSNVSSPDGTTAHGTAVVEIVHQMAPGATVVPICVGDNIDLWDAEQWAVNNGVKVINHSVAWFGTSRGDGTGGAFSPDAAVADARAHGILWVNAAGNQADEHWSGVFRAYLDDPSFNDFGFSDPTDSITIAGGATACIVLTWDAWPVTSDDYDWALVRHSDGVLVQASVNDQAGDPRALIPSALDEPVEDNCYANTGATQSFDLEIYEYSSQTPSPHLDVWVIGADSQEYTTTAGSIPEPASSPDAFAVGAYCWSSAAAGPPESYSSRGPTIDGRTKPDMEGPDSTSSSIYGTFSSCPSGFAGTSAAAPHVAGAAALLLQQTPSLSVGDLEAHLQELAAAYARGDGSPTNDSGTGKLWVGTVANPGRIVFGSENNGENGVYGISADGKGLQTIATGTSNDPALSPDGTKIAFSAGGVIEVMNADGTNVTTVWSPPSGHFYAAPSWSPDGTKLAFRDGTSIAVANADGTTPITVYALPGYDADEPVWSPDGTKLAVLGTGSSTTDIWTITVAGGATAQVTTIGTVETRERSLAWSSAGLVFSALTNTGGHQLEEMAADLSGSPSVILPAGMDPAWSPDLSKIIYSEETGNGHGGGLLTITPTGGEASETLIRSTPFDGWPLLDPTWTSGASAPAWNTGLPKVVSSSPQVGVGVEAAPGAWDGVRPIAFGYGWSRCDAAGNSCAAISGATDDVYVPVTADVGSTLRVTVTATNSNGSASVRSAASAVVAAATIYATAVPTISGTPQADQTLTVASFGTWTASTSFNYQWLVCNSDGSTCGQAVALNFGGTSYTVTSAEVGKRIRVAVEAGTGRWATSLATDVVTAAPSSSPAPSPPAPSPPPPSSGGGGGGGGGGGNAADIGVTGSVSPTIAVQGGTLVWTFVITNVNLGPAVDVFLDVTLSSNLTYVSSTTTRGPGCSQSNGKLHCFLDWMSGDAPKATITVTTTVATAGDYTATATAGQLISESVTDNNTVVVKASATAPAPSPTPPVPRPPASEPSPGPIKAPLRVKISATTASVPAKPNTKYQWQLCSASRCVAIKGATKRTLKLRPSYAGKSVRVVETHGGKKVVSQKQRVRARAASR